MTARDEIAAAASTVAGVNVTPYYRQNLQAGQGFVRLHAKARDNSGFGWMDTWQVWLALPQDIPTAEAWLDDTTPALIEALSPVLVLTTVTPSTLVVDANSVPGVVIEGAREG
jgi:hypothetical protein